jgi:hypothetical protein
VRSCHCEKETGEIVSGYNLHHLSGENLIKLRETNLVARLPDITAEELVDRAKDGPFIRTIAVAQKCMIHNTNSCL